MSRREEIHARVLEDARVHQQLIAACDKLLSWEPPWLERLLLRFVRGLYNHRLEMLLPLLPPEWEREIRGG